MKTNYKVANHADVKDFWALNTWTDEIKGKIRKALEEGYWVYLGSSAIGHTRAAMTEQDGLDWLETEYAGIIRYGKDDKFGWTVIQLI